MSSWLRVLQLGLLVSGVTAWAAGGGGNNGGGGDSEDLTGSKAKYEAGFSLGNLLPNQVPANSEILGLGDVRGGLRLANLTYAEAGLIMGNGHGVEWKDLHADIRIDIPVENLVGLAYLGADTIYYKGNDNVTRSYFGGHVGGGVQALITGGVWFRGDMKFSFSPGTSLYVGVGFVYRFGEG